MPRGPGASRAEGIGAVWIGARLPQAPDQVYLDATGLSIGGVHHAEKERDVFRASKARFISSFLRWAS
jgi:hypothetical protein